MSLPADPRCNKTSSVLFNLVSRSTDVALPEVGMVPAGILTFAILYVVCECVCHIRGEKENYQSRKYFFLINILICVDFCGKGEL